jgi:hypothetical protein
MRAAAIVLMLFLTGGTLPAFSQVAPDSENGRFTFNQVPDGLLRLDTRTGQVSLCSNKSPGWACHAVPDERTALEEEIQRLQGENAKLKSEFIAHGLPLPRGVSPEASRKGPHVELKLPSDAEVDRVMAFFEKLWRRIVEMVQSMQRDIDKNG